MFINSRAKSERAAGSHGRAPFQGRTKTFLDIAERSGQGVGDLVVLGSGQGGIGHHSELHHKGQVVLIGDGASPPLHFQRKY